MSKFIVLFPRLEISGANAQPAWWFVAPPSPTAYVGFGQALALKCLPPDSNDEFIGVGAVVHDFRLRAERLPDSYQWHPHQHRGATLIDKDDYADTKTLALSAQPSARCDLTVSLAVVFEEGASVDAEMIERFMRSARVAGGAVEGDAIKYELHADMAQVKQRLKTGFSLHARPDLMKPRIGEDTLDALLRATCPTADNLKANPWVMPALFGFSRITPVQDRIWTRDGHPHAFAEPLVGLVQLKPLRDAPIPIWKYQKPSHSNRVFLVGH